MFFLYGYTKTKTKTIMSILFLIITTILLTVFVGALSAPSHAMSIPFFTIGVVAADYGQIISDKLKQARVLIPLVALAMILIVVFKHRSLTIFIALNYFVVLAILLFVSFFEVKILGVPTWVNQYSFDVYLTHKKVLVATSVFTPFVTLWVFLILTAIVSMGFYWIRIRLKI